MLVSLVTITHAYDYSHSLSTEMMLIQGAKHLEILFLVSLKCKCQARVCGITQWSNIYLTYMKKLSQSLAQQNSINQEENRWKIKENREIKIID